MSLIYAFAASKSEAVVVASLLSQTQSFPSAWGKGRIGANEVVLWITGIGPSAAGAKAASALQFLGTAGNSAPRPGSILVAGTCGSLSRGINEGDVIFYNGCHAASKAGGRIDCEESLIKSAMNRLNARGILCRSALGISSGRIAVSKTEKLELAKTGAEVVDMESYEILAAAKEARVPTVVVRVVSDSLDRQMPDFNLALNETGDIDSIMLLKVAIGSPRLTGELLAASRRALGTLKRALSVVLSDEILSRVPPI